MASGCYHPIILLSHTQLSPYELSWDPTMPLTHNTAIPELTTSLFHYPTAQLSRYWTIPLTSYPAMLHPEPDSPSPECSIRILPPHYPTLPLSCYPTIQRSPYELSWDPTIPLTHYTAILELTTSLFHYPTTQVSHYWTIPLTSYPAMLHPEPDSLEPDSSIGILPPPLSR